MRRILLIASLFACCNVFGQVPVGPGMQTALQPANQSTFKLQTKYGQQPLGGRFLDVPNVDGPCMSPEELKAYNEESRIALQTARTGTSGVINRTTTTPVQFAWPMKVSRDYEMQYKYYYKGNFVDQYPSDESDNRDYNCGTRTYHGHDASDISLWPFWWRMMDKNYITAVAAAPGVIYFKEDGKDDKACQTGLGLTSNRIYIEHFDGTTSRYHHLRPNSMTTKVDGDTVQTGEFLGYIGSSGNSTNPHLHFAVYDVNGNVVEPFNNNNNCNFYSTESWWINQFPYWDSKISRIMTHSQLPVLGQCYDEELVYAKNNFNAGDFMVVGIAFSENQNNDEAECYIYQPDGDLFSQWSLTINNQDIKNYFVAFHTLPSGNAGTWKIRVSYRGTNYYHFFSVGCPASLSPSGTQTGSNGYISGNAITSTVNHSVSPGDKVMYQAQNVIDFKPGFHAPAGILLKTRFAGCGHVD